MDWHGARRGCDVGLGPRLASALAPAPLMARPIPVERRDAFQSSASAAPPPSAASRRAMMRRGWGTCSRPWSSAAPRYSTPRPPMARPKRSRAGLRAISASRKLFWATKVNVAPRGGGAAVPAAARAQIEDSFRRFGVENIDLIQVHNLADVPVQLGILKELKAAKRVRYIGVTSHQQIAVRRARARDARGAARFHRRRLRGRQPQRRGHDPAACDGAQDRRDGVRAVRPHAPVPARRRATAARLGR